MDKRKNTQKKHDVTLTKPETKERNHSAAKCAQNKEKTLDLIEIHETKIKNAVNNKRAN